ncbi:class I SAM-dependent methyltransferase [Thermococcus sp. GR6]|uniref:class I SAM-dependent methyltransferase n=1 Tax=Thermococcus sp. GR6 TaxID=1638256 RepID=UPI00142FBD2A|nr:class I SAM-dependent methyltransferase [Thermococcus sp. GR6]NJE42117.1 class I SAM-dependent methyltransferase [Thermococcus sp. GR6]
MGELYRSLARYYDVIYRARLERISQEIDFVEKIFRNDARREVRRVLDTACGTGAPTLELVRRGYEVVGLDINEEMLTVAREKAQREELSVEFMLGDAAALDFQEEFDAVTMFFSSILYLDEDRINELFNSVIKALRPGGVFVADWSNLLFYSDRGPDIREEREGNEIVVTTTWKEFENASQRLHLKHLVQIIHPDGEVRAFFTHENLNVYTAREMRLLAEKHFDEVRIYGDFQRELPANVWRLWLVGIKGQAP